MKKLPRLRDTCGRRSIIPAFHMRRAPTRSNRSWLSLSRRTGEIKFDNGAFPVLVIVDLRREWNCFVELIHLTSDDREGRRVVTGKVQLTRTEPIFGGHRWWFLCPRSGYRDEALFSERRLAFLEPPSLRPWVRLPARRSVQSASAASRNAYADLLYRFGSVGRDGHSPSATGRSTSPTTASARAEPSQ
jgi:hypothetical protein